ncbi:hypothetical protein MKW98_030834 [Papaver atlanticum]|uniref:Uncharacterized protein n=1 Tax=Papaver atlanticum TaxID=357466 RepID=A0AAD4X5U7_9MAGN|nr:hypothetical protein MKW98_030834 [Papaver atlanticum]
MAQRLEKSKNKTEELKSLSENLKTLAKEREKEVEPEKLKIKDAIEKENRKEMRTCARNMVRMRQEVTNYRQTSHRLDSIVDYFDKEPEQSVVFSFIPTIVESIVSSLATGSSKKLVSTMDEIEKRYFNVEVVSKFKYSSITENRPVFMSEEEKVSNLIQKVADECKLKVSVRLEHSPGASPTIRNEVKWFDDSQVKTKTTSRFNIFACFSYEFLVFA